MQDQQDGVAGTVKFASPGAEDASSPNKPHDLAIRMSLVPNPTPFKREQSGDDGMLTPPPTCTPEEEVRILVQMLFSRLICMLCDNRLYQHKFPPNSERRNCGLLQIN
jgi:hypothetical protein